MSFNITTELDVAVIEILANSSTNVPLHLRLSTNTTTNPNVTINDSCNGFNFIINGVIISTLCVIGWVCNTLTIATLFTDSKKSVTSFLLVILAVCDNGALAMTFLLRSLPVMCFYTFPKRSTFCWTYVFRAWPYFMHLRVVHNSFLVGSVWSTVLVAIHRAIAIKAPHKARTYSTMSRVRLQTVCMAVLVFLFCLPRCFEIEVVARKEINGTAYEPERTKFYFSNSYQIWYKNVAVNIFMHFIPLVILTILTYVLIQELDRAAKARKQSLAMNNPDAAGGKVGAQLTIMLVLVVVVFLVCQVPRTVYAILRVVLPRDQIEDCSKFWYTMTLSDLLVIVNSAINFFLYCVAGKKFRSQLKELCCKHCGKNPVPNITLHHTVVTQTPSAEHNTTPYHRHPDIQCRT